MNIETLKELTGWKRPTVNPTPTDLEIALARVNADHKSVLIAVKMLTEIAQSNAAANLDMAVVHEERNKASTQRHADVLKNMRELKKEMYHADQRHLAAFELALRPLLRAVEEVDKRLTNKLNNIDADLHAMRVDRNYELDAHTSVLNTKLNAIAIQIDDLVKILARDLIKHPEGVTVAPPKPKKKQGRRSGDKNRTLEERYKFLSHRLQVARPGSKARAKYMTSLVALRAKMGMAPMSDRALGKGAQ